MAKLNGSRELLVRSKNEPLEITFMPFKPPKQDLVITLLAFPRSF